MMMTAGVDAAGNLELQFTQIPLTLGVGETLADLLRHRNRPRIGKAAIIKTGAGDDVADKVKIGRREPSRIQLLPRSEEHTSELQSLMRISYAVFCLNKKKQNKKNLYKTHTFYYI